MLNCVFRILRPPFSCLVLILLKHIFCLFLRTGKLDSGNSQDGAGGGEKCPSPGMRASPLAVWAAAPFEPSSLQLQLHTQAQLPRDGLELRDSKPQAPAHRALIALTHKAGWPPCLSPRTIESCSHGLFSLSCSSLSSRPLSQGCGAHSRYG